MDRRIHVAPRPDRGHDRSNGAGVGREELGGDLDEAVAHGGRIDDLDACSEAGELAGECFDMGARDFDLDAPAVRDRLVEIATELLATYTPTV